MWRRQWLTGGDGLCEGDSGLQVVMMVCVKGDSGLQVVMVSVEEAVF